MNNPLATQIKSDLDRFCAAWKTNDGAALGAHFTADGSLINPFGQRADGRAAVAAMYATYFDGMLGGTSTTIDLGAVRPVGADHAFTDAWQTIFAPDGNVALAVHLTALLRNEGGTWRFVDARPFTPAVPPS